MKLSVDTVRFILFLYIQSTPRLSLKSSLLTGEEYPSIMYITIVSQTSAHYRVSAHVPHSKGSM